MTTVYYPELKQQKPKNAQIEIKRSSLPGKNRIETLLVLTGRGIELSHVRDSGVRVYYVTPTALKRLEKMYECSEDQYFD